MKASLVSSSVAKAKLKDFDWQLKLIMSSDKLSNIHQPVVAVDFTILTSGGKTQNKTLEMSKDELKRFLTSIEAANRVSQLSNQVCCIICELLWCSILFSSFQLLFIKLCNVIVLYFRA